MRAPSASSSVLTESAPVPEGSVLGDFLLRMKSAATTVRRTLFGEAIFRTTPTRTVGELLDEVGRRGPVAHQSRLHSSDYDNRPKWLEPDPPHHADDE